MFNNKPIEPSKLPNEFEELFQIDVNVMRMQNGVLTAFDTAGGSHDIVGGLPDVSRDGKGFSVYVPIKITPQNFKIAAIDENPYLTVYLDDHGIADQCVRLEGTLNDASDTSFLPEVIDELKGKLSRHDNVAVFTPMGITNPQNGLPEVHMTVLAFGRREDGLYDLTYLNPTGGIFKQDALPNLQKIIEGVGLEGKVTFHAKIESQQYPDQPNTCLLWGTRNASDFIEHGAIFSGTAEEASDYIQGDVDDFAPYMRQATAIATMQRDMGRAAKVRAFQAA